MSATVTGIHLGPDTHANRPAANAAGQPIGALYSCTTHGLIYKTDGSTWSTYATLGSGTLSDQGVVTYLDFTTAAAPSSPAAGKIRVYSKTGDHFAQKDSGGTETLLDATGGGGGALVLLQTQDASASATLNFESTISGTYDEYLIEFINIIPATDAALLRMRMGTGGGPTYDTGNNYNWAQWRYLAAGSGSDGGNAVAFISLVNPIDTTASANWSVNGQIRLFKPGGAIYKQVNGQFSMYDNAANAFLGTQSLGAYLSTTAVTAFQFFMSTGNISSGTIRTYGIAKT